MARVMPLLAVIWAVGCAGGKDDDGSTGETPEGDFHGSCYFLDYGDGQACIDYYGDLQFDNETNCPDQNGVYDASHCPTDDAVAFCRSSVAGTTAIFTYYGGHDVDMLDDACNQGGGEFSTP